MTEIPDWLKAHRQKMVDHILWLGERDSGYANYAVTQYLKNDPCPFPELKEAVLNELSRRKNAKV